LPAVDSTATSVAGRALELHPRVALRPEPFGALAYHYDTRRLVFLKHRDVVRVVESLSSHTTLTACLDACDIEAHRRPAFERAIAALIDSEMVRDRAR
jgi:putative mycofactocin binding protein MftB